MYDYRLLFPRLAEAELRRDSASSRRGDQRRVETVRPEPRARKERG
jgi:hypothetical protein